MEKEHYYGFMVGNDSNFYRLGINQVFILLQRNGFKPILEKTSEDNVFWLSKQNKRLAIEEVKDRVTRSLLECPANERILEEYKEEVTNFIGGVTFYSSEENKEAFKKRINSVCDKKQIANALLSEVLVEKDRYCTCVVKHNVEYIPISEHYAFIEKMKKLDFEEVLNQPQCFIYSKSRKDNYEFISDAISVYEDSKEKAKSVDLFYTGCPSFYLLRHEDAGAIDNLKRISLEGKSDLDLPEFVVHSRATDSLVVEKEMEFFLTRERSLKKLTERIVA